jgi:hypothetical protein
VDVTKLKGFQDLVAWYSDFGAPIVPDAYCETRDAFDGRLSKIPVIVQKEAAFQADESYLLAAVLGELGNNCFDHNLGYWQDDPGLHFALWTQSCLVIALIADRGRGIYSSLSAAHKDITDEQTALNIAFQKRISGRYPERRGNGLKFVRQVVNGSNPRGIWCRSGQAEVAFGLKGAEADMLCATLKNNPNCGGTFNCIVWAQNDHSN